MGNSKKVYDFWLGFWQLYKVGMWLGRQPGSGHVLKPLFSSRIHQVTMIPVNEAIAQGEQLVLPYTLLMPLVEQASTRFIMSECVCRRHENCQNHPIDLGCIFLGDGAAQIDSSMGELCNVEKAKAHIQRGMEAGLYPLIAHTVIDAITLGIPYKRMLTVCFCCECCCVVQQGMRKGPKSLREVIQPLPGLKLTIGEECEGCGMCIGRCPVGAISMNHQGVEISEGCKVCGICIDECPYEAIKMEISGNQDLIAKFGDRMRSYADITSSDRKFNLKP